MGTKALMEVLINNIMYLIVDYIKPSVNMFLL